VSSLPSFAPRQRPGAKRKRGARVFRRTGPSGSEALRGQSLPLIFELLLTRNSVSSPGVGENTSEPAMRDEQINVLPERPRTPVGVTILAAVMILASVLFVFGGLVFSFMGSKGAVIGRPAGAILLFLGGLHLVLAIGLLQHRNAARILTIFLFGLSTVGACIGLIDTSLRFSQVGLTWNAGLVGVDMWVLWYLLRRQIKNAFNA
jgi:hypothetical protein